MAQLKDTLVTGNLQVTNTILSSSLQSSIIRAPTTSNSSTYGVGEDGHVLQSNGSTIFWGKLSASNIDGIDNYLLKTGGNLTGPLISNSRILSASTSGIYNESTNALFYFLRGNTIDTTNKMGAIFMYTTTVNSVQVPDRFYFRHYSYNSTTNTPVESWEQYCLPQVAADRGTSKTYNILTDKNTVTILQGGTGGTTPAEARANLELGNSKIFYGTCNTEAATAIKEVTCTDFTNNDLKVGALIYVTFTQEDTNTAAVDSLKLKVNNSEAKPIKYQSNASTSNLPAVGYIRKNITYPFFYDGTNWVALLNYDSNTNTLMRTYALNTTTELPLLAGSTSTGGAWADYTSSYKALYGVISSTSGNRPTINPSTGKIKVPGGIEGNITGTASNVTGTVAIGNGGTGTVAAPTPGGIIYGSNATAYGCTSAGTTGQLLQSNGVNAPTWINLSTKLQDYIKAYSYSINWNTSNNYLTVSDTRDIFSTSDILIIGPGSTTNSTLHNTIINAQFEFEITTEDSHTYLKITAMGATPSLNSQIPVIILKCST